MTNQHQIKSKKKKKKGNVGVGHTIGPSLYLKKKKKKITFFLLFHVDASFY
jgi:hypothetical protein